jgi:CBS domain containing-hemolysin-like protein
MTQMSSNWIHRLVIIFSINLPCCAYAASFSSGNGPTVTHTQGDVVLLIVYVLLALIFSFLCSVAEAVLLSITPSYIAGIVETKPKLAALLKKLKQDNVDRSLAAILTLNTIAHTVGAIGSGAKATAVFGSAWFGLFSAIMTLMILFLSEIIPKTIGAVYWRSLTGPVAHFVRVLIWGLYPLIIISEALTRLIARGKSPHGFRREEFIAMATIGERSGQIDEQESRIIGNLFRFGSLRASDIMTPRTVIDALLEHSTVADALETCHTPFSRLPLYRADMDHIDGFVLRDDLLLAMAQNRGNVSLSTLKRKLFAVPGSMTLSDLLAFLLDHRQHMALVVDEFGGTKGLVTQEDVVETLLGLEIVDETDAATDMRVLARQQWTKRIKKLGLDVDPQLASPRDGKP